LSPALTMGKALADSMVHHAHQKIAQWLTNARHAVIFTGAGMSTESGIPDFRSPGGVWATNQPVMFDQFLASAEARKEYWRQKAIAHEGFVQAVPNAGHHVLARWEIAGKIKAIITQNIDGLHQDAGSRRVLELHGTARWVACLTCETRYDADEMVTRYQAAGAPPDCPNCGGIMKHATVSFGQALPETILSDATSHAQAADLFVAMGSSLVVHPAATLPEMAQRHGSRLVILNREPTPLDDLADTVLHAPLGETLKAVDEIMQ